MKQYSTISSDFCEASQKISRERDELTELLSQFDLEECPSRQAAELEAALADLCPSQETGPLFKNVSLAPSKNVSDRPRRSPANDAKTLAKMRSFVPDDDSATGLSSVGYSSLPLAPANDNLIPVWALTGDLIKAVCATVALQHAEQPAIAFTFNLTPETIAKAQSDPAGFLDHLKRSFDQKLRRAGVVLPYWFCIDLTDDARLHIHGAFLPSVASLPQLRTIRKLMKAAWGEWDSPGKHKQAHFQRLRDDGWATYCMRNQKRVRKLIGDRTFTVTQPLSREAKWVYEEARRIMREEV